VLTNWPKGDGPTERVTDLDYRSKMIIFGLILTTFELSSIFGGSWSTIENWLQPKIKPSSEIKLDQICETLCT
jgi:hypothetical protein